MSVKIFYFSGTGNSLLLGRRIAAQIKDAELLPAVSLYGGISKKIETDAVGFVFPVYCLDMSSGEITANDALPALTGALKVPYDLGKLNPVPNSSIDVRGFVQRILSHRRVKCSPATSAIWKCLRVNRYINSIYQSEKKLEQK